MEISNVLDSTADQLLPPFDTPLPFEKATIFYVICTINQLERGATKFIIVLRCKSLHNDNEFSFLLTNGTHWGPFVTLL